MFFIDLILWINNVLLTAEQKLNIFEYKLFINLMLSSTWFAVDM